MPKNIIKLSDLRDSIKNKEIAKQFTFNETGNVMIAKTIESDEILEKEVQKLFKEVSVFFSAMTSAITTSSNPNDGNKPYSIYNYHILQDIIAGSGLFAQVNEVDVHHETTSWGVTFSKELLEGLLGLASGAGSLAFATAMLASIGKEGLRIGQSSSTSESKVANIVFVCECLLGMPIIHAIVVSADCREHKENFEAGPCFHEQHATRTWNLHKDTYMFVPPSSIQAYAKDLANVHTNPDYIELIDWMQNLINKLPVITGLFDIHHKAMESSSVLKAGSYLLMGDFLPHDQDIYLAFVDSPDHKIEVWEGNHTHKIIGVTIKEGPETPSSIGIYDRKTSEIIAASPGAYAVSVHKKDDDNKKESDGQEPVKLTKVK